MTLQYSNTTNMFMIIINVENKLEKKTIVNNLNICKEVFNLMLIADCKHKTDTITTSISIRLLQAYRYDYYKHIDTITTSSSIRLLQAYRYDYYKHIDTITTSISIRLLQAYRYD